MVKYRWKPSKIPTKTQAKKMYMMSNMFTMKNPNSLLRSNLSNEINTETNENRQRKKRLVTNPKKYL